MPMTVEDMLAACIPGGTVCDPQQVADAIRAWYAERYAAAEKQRADLAEAQRDSWKHSCWAARDERDAETKRADALAERVKVTDAECEAIYQAVTKANFTRDVKSPERKCAVVRAALKGDDDA